MKYLFGLLVVLFSVNDLNKIAKVNALKKEAKEAFQNEDFELAAVHYRMLVDSFQVEDENVLLNLASAQYHLNDTVSAYGNYSELSSSSSNAVKSIAEQQLGLMKYNEQKYEEALHHYKQSLKADPTNEDSRYNYELLKKLLKEQEEEEKQDQNEDQENKDEQEKQDQEKQDQEKKDQEEKDEQEGEEKKEGEGEEKDEEGDPEEEKEKKEGEEKEPQEPEEGEEPKEQPEPSTEEKLKEMNISEEKAQMILEAMKNNEIQYIQQNKRKPTKRRDSKKPDW